MTVHLSAPAYVLGEDRTPHADLPGFAERIRELKMPPLAQLWGWGSVWRTRRPVADLMLDSGRAALAGAGLDPAGVDAVVLCCTRFAGGPDVHGSFVERVLTGLDLPGAAFVGVTLNRCANLMAGIDVAAAWVAARRYRSVLVITADRVGGADRRIEPFALFSDGAAACLVAADPYGAQSYELLGCAAAQHAPDLDWSHEISPVLSRRVNDELAKVTGVPAGRVSAVLPANLFLPVLGMKERQAGFDAGQLYTDNVARVGHCFAADPLINLVDRAAAGGIEPGGAYLLAVSVPGARHGVLLRAGSAS